jgi:hypothetical protein
MQEKEHAPYVTFAIELDGNETTFFKSKFHDWPIDNSIAKQIAKAKAARLSSSSHYYGKLAEEKKRTVDIEGMLPGKTALKPVEIEDIQDDGGGKAEVTYILCL